jgi:hypothetical protein
VKKRFTDEQIIGFLKQAEAGVPVMELCRQHGFSDASFYNWRAKFGGMTIPDAKRLRVRIPPNLDTHSTANWTPVPTRTGQAFRGKLDTSDVASRG